MYAQKAAGGIVAAMAAILALTCSAPSLSAWQGSTAPSTNISHSNAAPGLDDIQRLRDSATARTDLPDALKQELLGLYDATLESLRQSTALAEDESRFVRERQSAPAELEAARAEPAPAGDVGIEAQANTSLADLRTARDQADANLSQAQQRVTELDKDQARRTARRAEIPPQLARAEQDLDQARQALQTLDSQAHPDEPTELVAARRMELAARIVRLEQSLLTLKAELAGYDARAELNQLQRERAAKRVVSADKSARDLRDLVSAREQQQASEEAASARLAAVQAHPVVSERIKKNVKLLERLSGTPDGGAGLLARKAAAQAQLADMAATTRVVTDRFERELRIGEAAELTDVIDVRLRRVRDDLPDINVLRAGIDARRAEIATVQQALADTEYERDQLPDSTAELNSTLASLDPTMTPDDREAIARELERQIARQRELYDSLIKEYVDYGDWLLRLQAAEDTLLIVTTRFRDYIDERILWIRSMPAVGASDGPIIWSNLRTIFAPDVWVSLGRLLVSDARSNPQIFGAWLALFAAVFVLRLSLGGRLRTIATHVRNVYDDRFSYTMGALLITGILAAFWPAVMWFIAWRIDAAADTEAQRAIAAGLRRSGLILLVMQFYRHLCKNNGLGDAHFGWRESARRLLSRNFLWLVVVAVPLSFLIAYTDDAPDPDSELAALGRASFIAAMLACTVFEARVLRPSTGMLDGILGRARNGWFWQLRYVLYGAVVLIPVGLAITASLGYFYSALQLERRLVFSVWLILVLIVFHGLALRWLMIVRRRMALEEARKRRDIMQAESGASAAAASSADAPLVLDEPKLDINAVSVQTRRLVRSAVVFGLVLGILVIWVDMLPALALLKRVELWPKFGHMHSATAEVVPMLPLADAPSSRSPSTLIPADSSPSEVRTGAGTAVNDALDRVTGNLPGTASVQSAGERPPTDADSSGSILTLADVALFLVLLVATIVIARNIPGLLEITLLQWLTLEPSARYATATVARYIIVIVGVGLAFGTIGVGWNKVQWLAAAITLGIGFGLQEIFANFISGLILLFEQPIRVGDTVTVNGVDGTVTRIRMRATTITDYDRRELIIPNKAFITGQIINWTLTDATTRLVFPIGVAYGSDTALVEKTLLDIARENPLVNNEPAPQAVFTGFGDSTLNFSLRVFLPTLDNALRARHEINTTIERVFREKNIEIAFPQRDIHIRSTPRSREANQPIKG